VGLRQTAPLDWRYSWIGGATVNIYGVVIAGFIVLYFALRIAPAFMAKGGAGKKMQLWMLGERSNARAPRRDDVVM
jgi:hypothetical protein